MLPFLVGRIRGIIFDVPKRSICVFGYTCADKVVEIERDGTVRDGFVDVAFGADDGERLACERLLNLVEEPVIR